MRFVATMQGKVCLVTGATDGIGRVTAAELALRGAHVLVNGRDPAKTRATVDAIQRAAREGADGDPGSAEACVADLSSLEERRRLAHEVQERHPRLDVLVNNVGGCFRQRRESVDGVEMTWALNHLSYFHLTHLFDAALRAAPKARVVNVSSGAHGRGRIDFDDPEGKRRYHYWRAYRQSKLANILFTYELARRMQGTGITTNALHPGVVATSFFRNALFSAAKRALIGIFTITPEEGARTSLLLATSPELEGVSGRYFARERELRSSPASYDEETARRLWEMSAEQCGFEA